MQSIMQSMQCKAMMQCNDAIEGCNAIGVERALEGTRRGHKRESLTKENIPLSRGNKGRTSKGHKEGKSNAMQLGKRTQEDTEVCGVCIVEALKARTEDKEDP